MTQCHLKALLFTIWLNQLIRSLPYCKLLKHTKTFWKLLLLVINVYMYIKFVLFAKQLREGRLQAGTLFYWDYNWSRVPILVPTTNNRHQVFLVTRSSLYFAGIFLANNQMGLFSLKIAFWYIFWYTSLHLYIEKNSHAQNLVGGGGGVLL